MIGPQSGLMQRQAVSALAPPPGVRVWLACGRTDMRKGLDGLAMMAQQVLNENPFDGALFAFRGRGGGLAPASISASMILATRPGSGSDTATSSAPDTAVRRVLAWSAPITPAPIRPTPMVIEFLPPCHGRSYACAGSPSIPGPGC